MVVVSIIGGTGGLGKGLALRLSASGRYKVVIGSRSPERARKASEEYNRLCVNCPSVITGAENSEAASMGDYVILAIPGSGVEGVVKRVRSRLREGSVVISPVVPMEKRGGFFYYKPPALGGSQVSMAEYILELLKPFDKVVAALHTLPAPVLADLSKTVSYDVPIACDDKLVYEKVAELVGSIRGLRPLYAGPLSTARYIEQLVPLLLNLGLHNGIKSPSIKVV